MKERVDIIVCITGGQNPHKWSDTDADLRIVNWSIWNFIRILVDSNVKPRDLVLLVHPLMEIKYFLSVMIAKICGAKIIFFYESTRMSSKSLNPIVTMIKKLYFQFSDNVITVGSQSTDHVKSFGISPSRITELFNAVDGKEILKHAPIDIIQKREPGHRFLYVGQFIERKNVENLLRAFARCRAENDLLTLTGSGELHTDLQSIVSELGLQKVVSFTNYLSQIETFRLYYDHHTLVLPSKVEVWGVVVNEALIAGMHVVVSKNCGVCDLVRKFEGVYICNTNQEEISAAMRRSALEWRGRIPKPEITHFGTDVLAEKIISQINNVSKLGIK